MYALSMSTAHTSVPLRAVPQVDRPVEGRYLYQIINTVSSTLDVDRVLRAIVDLVSEAIDCHACFVYSVEQDDGSLLLRAVSDPYGALVDRLRFERGEGFAGWVAERDQPLFIPDNALADPRIKVVPEAEEEKYQSFCAAPLRSKDGTVIGVIALHAEAPKEFTIDDSEFLVHAASLVAGAIENARLYEDTRRRLRLVEGLSDLTRAVSAAGTETLLLSAVATRAQRLLSADGCQVLVVEGDAGRLRVGAASPDDAECRTLKADELGIELALAAGGGDASARLAAALWGADTPGVPLVVPMVVADELTGFLALRLPRHRRPTSEEAEIVTSIAGQTAVALRRVQLIDRLTERNAIKDLLEDLSHGGASSTELTERAKSLGCDLSEPHLVVQAVPGAAVADEPWERVAEALEAAVGRAYPGSLFDHRDSALRGLVRLNGAGDEQAMGRLREIHGRLTTRHPLAIGVSNMCCGPAAFATGFQEADHAVAAASLVSRSPAVVGFDDLGAYKYLLRVVQDGRVRDRRGDALQRLAEYDRRHRSQLLLTLEEYLRRRGNIAAAAQTLFVHPNTLRQRLRRIQDLTGLDVSNEDWLMIEIELKLLRLEQALGGGELPDA